MVHDYEKLISGDRQRLKHKKRRLRIRQYNKRYRNKQQSTRATVLYCQLQHLVRLMGVYETSVDCGITTLKSVVYLLSLEP